MRHIEAVRAVGIASVCGSVLAGCMWLSDGIRESGATGLTVDSSGRAVVLVKVCEAEMNEVLVFRSRLGDPTRDPNGLDNERVGIWKSNDPLERGVHELSLSAPGSSWRTKSSASLDMPDRVYGLGADDSENASTTGVEASTEAIANLTAGQVLVGLVGSSRTISRSEFNKLEC